MVSTTGLAACEKGLAVINSKVERKKNSHILTLKFSLHPVSQYINFNSDIGRTVSSSYVMRGESLWFCVPRSRLWLLSSIKVRVSFSCRNPRDKVLLRAWEKNQDT